MSLLPSLKKMTVQLASVTSLMMPSLAFSLRLMKKKMLRMDQAHNNFWKTYTLAQNEQELALSALYAYPVRNTSDLDAYFDASIKAIENLKEERKNLLEKAREFSTPDDVKMGTYDLFEDKIVKEQFKFLQDNWKNKLQTVSSEKLLVVFRRVEKKFATLPEANFFEAFVKEHFRDEAVDIRDEAVELFKNGQDVCRPMSWENPDEPIFGSATSRPNENAQWFAKSRLLEELGCRGYEYANEEQTFKIGKEKKSYDCHLTMATCRPFKLNIVLKTVHDLLTDAVSMGAFANEPSFEALRQEIADKKKKEAKFVCVVGICLFLTICTLMACRALSCSNDGENTFCCALWGEEHWSRHGGWEWRMVQIGSPIAVVLTVCFIIYVIMHVIMYIYVIMHGRTASWFPEIDFQALGFF